MREGALPPATPRPRGTASNSAHPPVTRWRSQRTTRRALLRGLLLGLGFTAVGSRRANAAGGQQSPSGAGRAVVLREVETSGAGQRLAAPVASGRSELHTASTAQPRGWSMVDRLAMHPDLFQYGPGGAVETIFGVPAAEARTIFYPVSRTRGLPEGYAPTDLVNGLGPPLRKLAVADFEAMFAAAKREAAYPVVVSGYRSAEYQAGVFERAVQRQLLRGGPTEQAEAEQLAARFVAPPGRSQHQLGTTADLSSGEIGYAINARFAETAAGRWLAEHAWEYGFVVPYTAAAESRSGYVPEPWHLRWVGRPLAALLWQEGYFTSGYPIADDWLLVLELVLARQSGLLDPRSDP